MVVRIAHMHKKLRMSKDADIVIWHISNADTQCMGMFGTVECDDHLGKEPYQPPLTHFM